MNWNIRSIGRSIKSGVKKAQEAQAKHRKNQLASLNTKLKIEKERFALEKKRDELEELKKKRMKKRQESFGSFGF